MKELIVNADDFGLHEAVNHGIITGHTTGCITSTTIIANGQAFEHAVQLARENPSLGVGVHLTLVGEKPLLDPSLIPSLVNEQGMFNDNYGVFMRRYAGGQIKIQHIRQELTAQVEKVLSAGIHVTHLDSHQHLHVLPGILDVVLAISNQFGITALRIPDEPFLFAGGYSFKVSRFLARGGLTFFARLARYRAQRHGLSAPDHFFGMLAGGSMSTDYLAGIVANLPEGITEIMVHPGADNQTLGSIYGWNYKWEQELKAVTSSFVQGNIHADRIKLISFREMAYG